LNQGFHPIKPGQASVCEKILGSDPGTGTEAAACFPHIVPFPFDAHSLLDLVIKNL
jgi:hypothetical protein